MLKLMQLAMQIYKDLELLINHKVGLLKVMPNQQPNRKLYYPNPSIIANSSPTKVVYCLLLQKRKLLLQLTLLFLLQELQLALLQVMVWEHKIHKDSHKAISILQVLVM